MGNMSTIIYIRQQNNAINVIYKWLDGLGSYLSLEATVHKIISS